jgi:hypothetical protein
LSTFSEGTVGFTASSVMPRTALAASVARRMPTRALSSSLKSASLSQDVRVEELSAVPKRENHLLNRLGNPRFVAAPMVRSRAIHLAEMKNLFSRSFEAFCKLQPSSI